MTDKIEKRIELNAPVSRVWRALTDHLEFSAWFGVKLESPFVVGRATQGHLKYPGYEHLRLEVVTQKMENEKLFSYTWHPYAIDPKKDYSNEPSTLVEFKLQKTAKGTLLIITESGFDKIPSERRLEAFRMNDGGWTQQAKNISGHVEKTT